MEITNQEFHQITQFVKHNYGVDLTEKRALVEGRLSNHLEKNGFRTYSEYMKLVIGNPFGEEASGLVNLLTTNHTFFLREAKHFNFLREAALPELIRRERSSRDLGIWSAASSSGEEAYTIAMVLRDTFRTEREKWDTTILATDISQRALSAARTGIFNSEQVSNLPKSWLGNYFNKIGEEQYELCSEIKKQVIFRYFNLMETFPFRRKFHIVFLRNVMIYFDEETKAQLLNKVYDVMEPGGFLFIGTTEIIDKSRSAFVYLQPSIYRK